MRQCSSRSLPPGESDQGHESATFGAHSRQLFAPSAFCTSSARTLRSTAPSVRTPPQLQTRLRRLTPFISNALPRVTSRRGSPACLWRRTGAWPRGRASSSSLHSAAISVSLSRSAFASSARSSSVVSLSICSLLHFATRPRGRTGAARVSFVTGLTSPARYTGLMSAARGPLGLCSTSYWTLSFSFSVLNPLAWMDEKCTKRSLLPSSGVMKPKPLASLNHFTVPVLMSVSLISIGKKGAIGREAALRKIKREPTDEDSTNRYDPTSYSLLENPTVPLYRYSDAQSTLTRARPGHALAAAADRADALVDELLQALALVGLGRVEVALRVGGDAVHAEELAGLAAAVAEAGQLLQRLAQDDAHLLVAAVGHEDVALLRIAREGDVPDRAFAQAAPRIPLLLDELAVLREHLQAIVLPVANVHQAVVRDVGAVHRVAELLRRRRVGVVGPEVAVVGLVAVGAPVALHLAGVGVEHGDALVLVAVGDERLVGLRVDEDLRHAAEVLQVVAAFVVAVLAHLQQELAVLGELQHLRVLRAVAADPDIALVVDEDAMVRLGPLVAHSRAAPVPHQVAGLVEHQHRRRAAAAFAGRWAELQALLVVVERGRTAMDDPDVVLLVDPDTDRHAEQPVVGQGLGPQRIDFEHRRLHRLRLVGLPVEERLGAAERRE